MVYKRTRMTIYLIGPGDGPEDDKKAIEVTSSQESIGSHHYTRKCPHPSKEVAQYTGRKAFDGGFYPLWRKYSPRSPDGINEWGPREPDEWDEDFGSIPIDNNNYDADDFLYTESGHNFIRTFVRDNFEDANIAYDKIYSLGIMSSPEPLTTDKEIVYGTRRTTDRGLVRKRKHETRDKYTGLPRWMEGLKGQSTELPWGMVKLAWMRHLGWAANVSEYLNKIPDGSLGKERIQERATEIKDEDADHYVYTIKLIGEESGDEWYYVGTSVTPENRITSHRRKEAYRADEELLLNEIVDIESFYDDSTNTAKKKAMYRERESVFEVAKRYDTNNVFGGR